MVKSPPHDPQPSPRASRPSFRGRDGRRSRKPGARACRCGQSNGSWASTGPPSGVIWRPEVLQDGSSGWCPIRQHRIPWQRNGVTFSLNTYPDIFPDLRHPSCRGTFCRHPWQLPLELAFVPSMGISQAGGRCVTVTGIAPRDASRPSFGTVRGFPGDRQGDLPSFLLVQLLRRSRGRTTGRVSRTNCCRHGPKKH